MSLFTKIGAAVRRKIHQRDIDQSLAHYARVSGQDAGTQQSYSDTGTFRSHVDRLFSLGNAAETQQLKHIAESSVQSTVTNRYYRAADYLSDIIDDLDRQTYLTGELAGEASLSSLEERYQRELKLKAIIEAWLVPLKVGSIETSLVAHTKIVGRLLPYTALQRFERNVARLFASVTTSERRFMEEQISQLLADWRHHEILQTRFAEPADAVVETVQFLRGEANPDGVSYLRTRRPDAPLRLATAVPEDRQHYLRASFARWELASSPES
jgi:hypothetical protein